MIQSAARVVAFAGAFAGGGTFPGAVCVASTFVIVGVSTGAAYFTGAVAVAFAVAAANSIAGNFVGTYQALTPLVLLL
jgi:hypothetical protein